MGFVGTRLRVFVGRFVRASAAVLALLLPSAASASVIVAPNANTATPGNSQQFGVLDTGNVTFQFAYDASQFSGVAVGSTLKGIEFRLPAGAATLNSALAYSSYSIEVATAAVPVGSLSSTFASNESADNTVVRSGALTIPANSLIGGAGPNPFYEINFTTPFVYNGGSLVVTLRHSDPGLSVSVDANTLGAIAGIGNTVANFGSNTATTGTANFFNAPVAGFDFSPPVAAPEPSSLVLAASSLLLLPALAVVKLRRRRAAA
jgi:hypothetical protein